MKSVSELRTFDFNPEEVVSSVKYFKKQNIDWDVYLPSIGKNLQRDFVWSLEQKRELIWSVLFGRHVPHMSFINVVDRDNNYEMKFLIIDGKQRLSTLFDFVDNKFTLEIEEKEYLFSQLPEDYQRAVNNFHFRYYIVNEDFDKKITDKQKIDWFKFINFAGTPQDKEHMSSLE